ncbi:MAG: DNA polymerase III subunit alpha [Candidatus Paceibacterota bacterium]|jgi:DNA polymerase-3 subunit alpha
MKFVHLHTHSHYSLLQALPKIPDMVLKAKEDGMEALALTDAGNLYGAIEFFKECKKAGVKPILGVDFYVAARSRKDKEPRIDNRRTRLVLLAKDLTGYKNLLRLVTDSHLEGFYYRPRIDRELIEKYHEGLIAITPSFSGEVAQALRNANIDLAKDWLQFYKNIFADDFYVEMTRHPEIEDHDALMDRLFDLAKENNVPVVAAHDVYYLSRDEKKARTTLLSVQKSFGGRSAEEDEGDFSFITDAEAQKLFKKFPEALANTEKVVEKCNLDLPLGKWMFPTIDLPEGVTGDDELKRIVYEGFKRRGVEKNDENIKRVEYELGVIRTKGYAPYFLVVADLLRHARENGILSNIRGSVSGSMVTFLAGITNIDPIEYEIPFERFLNPDRPSAPDIDMDYADNRRDEMVEYTRKKYGEDKVAQIGTFGTMAARGSVRDIARALGYDVATGDRISKMIPMGSQGFPMTIEKALDENPDLKAAYKKEEDTKKIIDMAKKIEGCARHIGVHAAGVVISPVPLIEIVPLQFDPKSTGEDDGKIITQYDMYSIDEDNAGLLKFDFLGLKNLSIVADTLKLVKRLKGKEVNLDTIPIDDKKTFEMLARGETADVFQLNGDGMTRFLIDLKPTSIHDINAMVALYRPGPIQFIPEYIARKHDKSRISYLDPALEEILQKTYGILVYQDDLLMMAHNLAGYTWGEVDKFRKAVGKKIPEEMALQKEKFIKGCVEHSKWSEKKATEIWGWIEPFAAYGFNKAHSVSYGRVAYITAYLKANFPAEYMSAVLTHESGDVEKVAESVAECKRMGIEVLPPDINESFEGFTVIQGEGAKDRIRFGLTTVKNFGEGIAKAIIDEREASGKFKSLADFLERVTDRNLNKKSLEALIKCGALDHFGERGSLMGNLDGLLEFNKEAAKGPQAQTSLFGNMTGTESTLTLKPVPEAESIEKLAWEKELLGLYISGHPLDKYRAKMEAKGISIANVLKSTRQGQNQMIVGVAEEVKEIRTKKGDLMAFMRLADFTGPLEVVLFPKTYEDVKALVGSDKVLAVEGTMSKRNDTWSMLANKIRAI